MGGGYGRVVFGSGRACHKLVGIDLLSTRSVIDSITTCPATLGGIWASVRATPSCNHVGQVWGGHGRPPCSLCLNCAKNFSPPLSEQERANQSMRQSLWPTALTKVVVFGLTSISTK